MLRTVFFLLVSNVYALPVFTQNWVDAGIPLIVSQIRATAVDTLNNKMYACGIIPIDQNGNGALAIYDGTNWTTQDSINNLVLALQIYNGDLYMGGDFVTINSQSMPYIAKWDGSNWINIGGNFFGRITCLKVINNDLYAMGTFTNIGNIAANNIAKWNGTSWTSLNFPYYDQVGWVISDCALYNGDLYVGGNFETPSGLSDIAVLKNGVWQRVGGAADSIRGSFSGISNLEVFNNELYAAGLILHWQGNVGNGIQRWDGLQWKPVGTGIQGSNNSINNGICQIHDIKKHKDRLIAGGTFSYAGNSKAPFLAAWDGISWCAIDTLLDEVVGLVEVFRDTLFIGTLPNIEGNYVNSFAKFVKGEYNYSEKCINFDVGINEYPLSNQIQVYPNPTNSILHIRSQNQSLQHTTVKIIDCLGRQVVSTPYEEELDVSTLAPGMYYIEVQTNSGKWNAKFIKQ